ncbi:MAG: metallophosphoesterase [Thermogladius sp.]
MVASQDHVSGVKNNRIFDQLIDSERCLALVETKPSLYKLVDGLYIYPGLPFAYLSELDALVMSDLHLGFEEAAAKGLEYSLRGRSGYAGVFLPRIQFRRTVEMLARAFKIRRPGRVIINGDLKHAFDRLLRQEKEEVSRLIDFIREGGVDEVTVVRGNHDNFVKRVLEEKDVLIVDSIETSSGFLITHGHLDVDPSRYSHVVIGHEHPSIRCFGGKMPVFLRMPLTGGGELVVLPATGPYHPGTTFSLSREDYLSPLIRKYGVLEEASFVAWVETSYTGHALSEADISRHEKLVGLSEYRFDSSIVTLVHIENPVLLQALCEF